MEMARFDIAKFGLFILKRCWLLLICAEIGFGFMYWRAAYQLPDTYTTSGTMYVYNANPNLLNYGYTSTSDLNSAVQLLNTYMVVVKSNKVLDAVVDRLLPQYPNLTAKYIAGSISMSSVGETGVVRISCSTDNPQRSADICNAVMDVAPNEIIRVVGAGAIEIIDYASVPKGPDSRSAVKSGMVGAVIAAAPVVALLALMYLFNQKIEDAKELTAVYTLPILATLKREKKDSANPSNFLLSKKTDMETIEDYAKLRMNLLYTLVGKEKNSVLVTSSVSGEGKSTISANLAISIAMSGKKVLLVDADMRRGSQYKIFGFDEKGLGFSDVLVGKCKWRQALRKVEDNETLNVITAGDVPPNPAELLESPTMSKLLAEMEAAYDLVVLDVPPINIVSDPLALSSQVAGGIFVIRQRYSDHREIKKALKEAEQTGLNLLGFAFYGENLKRNAYYKKGYYNSSYYLRSPESPKKAEKTEPLIKFWRKGTSNASDASVAHAPLPNANQQAVEHARSSHPAESLEKQINRKKQELYRKRKAEAYRKRRSEQYRRKRSQSN